jgi:hypothetical protein
MSRRWPVLKNNNQLTMVGRLDAVCNRGVGKEAMGEGEDNGGEEEHNEAHPIDKTGGETQRRQQK